MVPIPKRVFDTALSNALASMAKPPTRRYAGVRLRGTGQFTFPTQLLHPELSTERGLPEADQEAGIARTATGELMPTKTLASSNKYKIKLQDPEHVKGFARFESRFPQRGSGASMLLLSRAAEQRGRKTTGRRGRRCLS